MYLKFWVSCLAIAWSSAGHADEFVLEITDTGQREYYCQIMVTLKNTTSEDLTEISGHFFSYLAGEQVGRSKGAWFMNVPAGQSATAIFETPNAPCNDVEMYEFIVGACRFSSGFEDQSECAGRIGTVAPISRALGM